MYKPNKYNYYPHLSHDYLIQQSHSMAANCYNHLSLPRFILSFNFIRMHREDSIDRSGLKEALKSTGTSVFYKAIGRDTRPAWTNRIIKDFNDLDYEVKQDILKSPSKFRNNDLVKKKRVREDINNRIDSSRKGSKGNSGRSQQQRRLSKSNKIRDVLMTFSQRNPETIDLGELQQFQGKYLGLCPFEFQNTIQGKMERKSNLHLSLDKNRVSRLVNVNSVQYNHNKDIDISHRKLMEERQRMKKYHPFYSYTERRVFEPRQELDKFYNTEKARRAASPNRQHNEARKFDSVLQRRDSKMSESVGLSYEIVSCIDKLKQKSVSYSIKETPREIVFMPQVISEQRGCYR